MKHDQTDDRDSEVMDEHQAALFLGFSTRKMRGLRQRNEIHFALVGRQVRYLRSELLKLIANGGTKQQKGNE